MEEKIIKIMQLVQIKKDNTVEFPEEARKLFLFRTSHSGGTSTRAKCRQFGVDSSENVEFKFSEEEDG